MSISNTEYETVIGLETHVHLRTRSKMFCSCERDYFDADPNTHVCAVCLGMPGVLPVINSEAVTYTILTGLALGCRIPEHSKFDRKNYPYPDLMKGYQISQYDQPLCLDGGITIDTDGQRHHVRLERIHLEEDTARLLHRDGENGDGYTLMDVNRAGVPLMEVVTRPDMRSPEEAIAYMKKLRQTLRYLNVSDADMDKGSFRCDANISLRPHGTDDLGAKVEIKNMNSFRAVQRALESEQRRQANVLNNHGSVEQETRGYIDATGETVSQRSKEEAHDYRYFPEPDLPPLEVKPDVVRELQERLPELPDAKQDRLQEQHNLSSEEARLLTETQQGADAFEKTVALAGVGHAQILARWMVGDVAALLNQVSSDAELAHTKLTPEHLAELIILLENEVITATSAKEVLQVSFDTGAMPSAIVDEQGLQKERDEEELDRIALSVIDSNPKAVHDFNSGKDSAIKFLVGQVMRETRGRADPNSATEVLTRHLRDG